MVLDKSIARRQQRARSRGRSALLLKSGDAGVRGVECGGGRPGKGGGGDIYTRTRAPGWPAAGASAPSQTAGARWPQDFRTHTHELGAQASGRRGRSIQTEFQSSSSRAHELHMARARSYLLRHGAFVFAGDEHARTTRSIIQPVWHGMVVCTRGARATPPGDLIPRLPPRAGWPSRHSRHANRKDKTRWVPRFDGRAAPRAGEFQTVAPAAVAAALARLQIGVPLP